MADWTLRRAEAGDGPALALVAAASMLNTFAGIIPGPDILAHCANKSSPGQFEAWIASPDGVVTIAEHARGAAPLGYAVLCPADLPIEPLPGDIELRRIYTLACAQGTGLGAALMARAIADARDAGHARMLLGVYGENHRARRFYERHGFTQVGTRRFQVGESLFDDAIYGRAL